MFSPALLRRIIILCFMALVGYAIAKSLDAGSITGIILSAVSLGAAVYFLYLLQKASEQQEETM